MTNPPDDDWSLLARAGKDPGALAELFRRHRDSAWRFALARCGDPDLASDITQELFLRLADYRRPVFRKAKFTTWLYRVTANLAVDEWRRQTRSEAGEFDERMRPVESGAEQQADLARVMAVMGTLPERQRQAFHLRMLEQWSTEDTAAAMGITTGSVKTHLQRALQAVRTHLEET